MFSVLKRNPVSVILAVMLHIMIVAFLVFGYDWSKFNKPATPKANVVQAHTVDAKQLDQAKEKEEAVQREKLEEARKRKQEQEKRHQQQLEQKRIAEQKAKQQKLETERKRQAQLKKEQAAKEAKRKAEQKRLAELEAKRKAEEKRKAELERKRKAELEARRKAEQRRKAEAAAQAERERALQEQLAAEQNSREIDRYVAVIKQQVERNWLKPGQGGKDLSCVVQVRLIPGGDVVPGGVSILRSSGSPAFDRSVEAAVYKAAPLQVPSGSLFESFRTLKLNFKPSG